MCLGTRGVEGLLFLQFCGCSRLVPHERAEIEANSYELRTFSVGEMEASFLQFCGFETCFRTLSYELIRFLLNSYSFV